MRDDARVTTEIQDEPMKMRGVNVWAAAPTADGGSVEESRSLVDDVDDDAAAAAAASSRSVDCEWRGGGGGVASRAAIRSPPRGERA